MPHVPFTYFGAHFAVSKPIVRRVYPRGLGRSQADASFVASTHKLRSRWRSHHGNFEIVFPISAPPGVVSMSMRQETVFQLLHFTPVGGNILNHPMRFEPHSGIYKSHLSLAIYQINVT